MNMHEMFQHEDELLVDCAVLLQQATMNSPPAVRRRVNKLLRAIEDTGVIALKRRPRGRRGFDIRPTRRTA